MYNFINCENVSDIVDLYPIADVLISDYSASIYEYALTGKKIILYPYDYDKFSKYTIKNISRYMGERNKVSTIPYNTLFFEAAEEAKVPDLFLRLRKSVDEDDRNGFFIAEVGRTAENIIYRLQDLQMKI